MPARLRRDLLACATVDRHSVELFLEGRRLVGPEVESLLVRRQVDVEDFPFSARKLATVAAVRRDRVEMCVSAHLRHVIEPAAIVVPSRAAVRTGPPDPRRITQCLQRRELA